MARKAPELRYAVDESEKTYAEPGVAISLTQTIATRYARAGLDHTVYARDTITGEIVGHSESIGETRSVRTHRR